METTPSKPKDEKTGFSSEKTVQIETPPHVKSADDVLKEFNVDPTMGLSVERAADLLAKNGPNRLKPPPKPSRLKIFLGQIMNAMTIVLIGAMAVSVGTNDWIAAGVIGALVVLNVSVGYSRAYLNFVLRFQCNHSHTYLRGVEGRKCSRRP
jgi:magnesium-transporting ATPase (P-type)